MGSLAVNISPTGLATPAELRAAGTRHVRIPLWPAQNMRAIIGTLKDGGISTLPCCDSLTLSVSADPMQQARYWHDRVGDLVSEVQWAANEFEQEGSASSTAAEPVVYEQLKAGRAVWTNHLLLGPNLASGQPDRWTKRLDDLVDRVMLSCYPPNAAQMADGLYGPGGYGRFGTSIGIGEFPIWSEAHVTEALRLSDWPAYVYNWRSWFVDQERHWPDGLLDLAGNQTWRYEMFQKYAKESEMAEFKFGNKAYADAHKSLVGAALEDEQYFTPTSSVQVAEGGVFFYSKTGNKTQFLPNADNKAAFPKV